MFGSRAGAEKNNFCAILFSDMLANIILRFPWVVNQQTPTFPFVHFFFGGGGGGRHKESHRNSLQSQRTTKHKGMASSKQLVWS